MNGSAAVRVRIEALRIDGTPRAAEDAQHVRVLAAVAHLPPIVAHGGRVVDGVHRLRAAQARGETDIDVRYFHGDEAEAFVYAVRANLAGGLPLTRDERKAACLRVIGYYPTWSDRRVAAAAGLSPKTVGRLRGVDPDAPARVGRDGRVRPVDAARRRALAREVLRERPDLPLRQVASAAGISPETARSVRDRMRRGAEPPTGAGPTTFHALRADPSLRFTEHGRALLRLLDAHALGAQRWAAIGQTVPAHCRTTVADAAWACARSWARFADQLGRPTD